MRHAFFGSNNEDDVEMTFSELKNGEYFTMKKGLVWTGFIWEKTDNNHAMATWSGRIFPFDKDVEATNQFDKRITEHKEKLI